MLDHLDNAGLTHDGIIWLSMMAVCVAAWIGNELTE